MTKQEIIAEINAKIAGQGTNIDAGSALPGILQGIIDLIPEAPTPQVQADLTVIDPDSPAFVKGILRVDVVTKPFDLFALPDWVEDFMYLGGIPFVQDVGNLAIYPYNGLNDTQKEDMLAYAQSASGAELDELISFFGFCSENYVDGASGIAIVTFNAKPYCVPIEQ